MAYDPNLGYDPSNIAQSINEAAARGDDAEVERLAVERYNKIQADPNMMKQYGTDAYSQVAQNVLKRTPTNVPQQTAAPAAPVTGPAAANNFSDVMSWIDAMTTAQKQAAVAGVDQARTSALSNLQAERATIAPQYQQVRQTAASQGAVEQQRINEAMAQRGLAESGAAGELSQRQSGVTQGAIASATLQEQAALDDILRRQNQVEQEYQSALQAATSTAEANRLAALIQQVQSDRQYTLQEAGMTGVLNGTQTMAGASAAREASAYDASVADTALQRQIDTVGQYSGDYAKEINNRIATPDTADDALIPYLRMARAAKVAAQEAATNQQAQNTYDSAMNMFKTTGVASGWVAQTLGVPEGATTAQYLQTLYNISKPYYNPNTGGGGGTDNFSELMAVWKAKGTAPKGLEAYGVVENAPYGGADIKPLGLSDANKEITSILSIGQNKKDPRESATAQQAYDKLVEMVDAGLVSEADAESITMSNPALKTYAERLTMLSGYQGGR